jgi:hypothetical protein
MLSWEDRIAEFWRDADDTEPVRMRIQIDQLLSAAECSDARALFERACLEDFLCEESAAVPLYEASLSYGLDIDRENQARIQLASSLRNVGRQDDALRMLEEFEFSTNTPLREMHSWHSHSGTRATVHRLCGTHCMPQTRPWGDTVEQSRRTRRSCSTTDNREIGTEQTPRRRRSLLKFVHACFDDQKGTP